MNRALENGETAEVIARNLGHKLSMEAFRENLIHQLIRFSLPTNSVGKMQPWLHFSQTYFHVIADCPVVSCNQKMTQVDRLAVRLRDTSPQHLPGGAAFAFTINWTFTKGRDIVLEWNNEVLYPKDYKPGVFYQLHTSR